MTDRPKPDRSDRQPTVARTADQPQIDVGWAEGVLPDGRPFRAEAWAEEGITSLTVFFSTAGLEAMTNREAADLLEGAGLVEYQADGRRSAYAVPIRDAAGQHMWSVNVVLGDDEGLLVRSPPPLRPYSRPS